MIATLAIHPSASLLATLAAATTLAAQGSAQPDAVNNDAYLVAAVILALVGVLILIVELFVPTGGLLAILCAVSFVGSIVAMYMFSTTAGTLLVGGYVVVAPFALVGFLKLWAKSPIVRKYALRNPAGTKVIGAATAGLDIDPDDPEAGQAASDDARRMRLRNLASLVGERGIVETPLRPVGFVRVGGRRLDASAETGLIDAGTPIRVVGVLDGTLKVREERGDSGA
jgi:membrane-bound ClpP family serine protease